MFQLLYCNLYFVEIIHQAHVKRVFGLSVERLALTELLLYKRDNLLGSLVKQQRAYGLPHLQMLHEHIGGALEIDLLPLLVDIVHVVEEARCTSATTQHDILKLSHLVEHVALYFAKAMGRPKVTQR